MLLSDDTLRAIGRIAVLAGHLELSQYFLTGALVGPDPEAREEIARPADNFSVLQNLSRRLIASRYAALPHRAEHPLKSGIEEWIGEARSLMEARNAIVHGTWGVGVGQTPTYLTKRKPFEGKSMTVADLDALGDRMEVLHARSHNLIDAVAQDTLDRARRIVTLLTEQPAR